MTRYLVDTSVLVDLSRWVEPTRSILIEMTEEGHELCVCAVIVTEFFSGVPPSELHDWREFFGSLRFLTTDMGAAEAAGIHRQSSKRTGRAVATPDATIAAVAQAWDATLLTENPKHFELDGLTVRSLRTWTSRVDTPAHD